MSKLLTVLSIICLLPISAGAAIEKPKSDDEAKVQLFKFLLAETGYDAFKKIKALNAPCVEQSVSNKAIQNVLAGLVAVTVVESIMLKRSAEATDKFIRETVKSELHSTNKAALMKDYVETSKGPKPAKRGFGVKVVKGLGLIAAGIGVSQYAYYMITGGDLLTPETFAHYYHQLKRAAGQLGDGTMSSYYASERGFPEFLSLNSEEEVKMMFGLNPQLAVGTLAISQIFEEIGSCKVMEGVMQKAIRDEEPTKASPSNDLIVPQKPRGELL